MNKQDQNLRVQKFVTLIALALFAIKMAAWYLTRSVAIFTDALESTTNVVSAFIGLYSLYLSAQPKDRNHPYGHGKVEFISAGIEGTLISIAGLLMIYAAINHLRFPHPITHLNKGIILIASTAIINFAAGTIAHRRGQKNNSLALVASGKHLQADAYTTLGIMIGLFALLIFKLPWIDSAVALVFAVAIIYAGVRILRTSVAGIMDEVDKKLLVDLVAYLNQSRRENWMDIHNLRIIKYGPVLHIDCHLTVPWYFNVIEAHNEGDLLEKLIKEKYGDSVELFVHTDACADFSCPICIKDDCSVRKAKLIARKEWTLDNISVNRKHHL